MSKTAARFANTPRAAKIASAPFFVGSAGASFPTLDVHANVHGRSAE